MACYIESCSRLSRQPIKKIALRNTILHHSRSIGNHHPTHLQNVFILSSTVFIEEHAELPTIPDDGIESVIAALMVWSDATQLGNFGNTLLWPIHFFFGNQTKYTCAKPSEFAAHHLVYIPKVLINSS